MAKKDVAVTKKAVATVVDEDLEAAMVAASGEGSNFAKEDMAIPFLRILQKMSPQLSRKEGEYIEGAQEGMVMNTVTGEIWEQDQGIIVIPCAQVFKNILWKPRDSGGGFVNQYPRNDPNTPQTEKDDRGRDITGDGNILTPTSEHYVLVVGPEGDLEPALMSMSSSQLKVSRKWCAFIDQQKIGANKVKAPHFKNYYKLTTVDESNDQGSWCGWHWEVVGPLTEMSHFTAARSFSKSILEGDIKTAYVEADPTADVM